MTADDEQHGKNAQKLDRAVAGSCVHKKTSEIEMRQIDKNGKVYYNNTIVCASPRKE